MRRTGWLLTFAMIVVVVDVGLERSRRGRQAVTRVEAPQMLTSDGGNGRPPTPKP
jgi:hypothetical protein